MSKRMLFAIISIVTLIGNILMPLQVDFYVMAAEKNAEEKIADERISDEKVPEEQTTGQEIENDEETVKLEIDNENIYEGMNKTYSEGYVPIVADGKAVLVIPLVCKSGQLKNNELSISINLGDPVSMPFVNKNYSKTIKEKKYKVGIDEKEEDAYLVEASLDLREDRINGSYPVIITVNGSDINGNNVEKTFTVYVNITDGKDLNEEVTTEAITEVTTEEPVVYTPKVLVDNCKVSKQQIYAGDEIEVTVVLLNTSNAESIHNMTVTANANEQYFTIESVSDSMYIGNIAAAGEAEVKLKYKVGTTTPQGQYNLELNMDYADAKGMTYSSSGNAKLYIWQPVNVEFDKPQLPESAKVGEVIDISMQAMNLGRGKVYNVRGTVECDGITPAGTLFIGDMEPGSTANASITGTVISLRENDAMYGAVSGRIIYTYEDEQGEEYIAEDEIIFTVDTPFSNKSQDKQEKDKPEQWWWIIGVLSVLLIIITIICVVINIRIKKRQG